jgi:hypothetical protein
MGKKDDRSPLILLFFSLFMFWGFGYHTAWRFLKIDLDGVVISSKDIPSTAAPRHSTEYVIRGSDGLVHAYVSGPSDGSLPTNMPVGTRIKKRRWSLHYERDGEWYSFPYGFYSVVLTGAFCGIVSALVGILRSTQE